MDKETYEIKLRDRGPCFHSEDSIEKIQDWIDHLCPVRHERRNAHGGQIEDLAWLINIDFDGTIEFIADQWVGVGVTGTLWKVDKSGQVLDSSKNWRYDIFLESDSLLAGLAGCYAFLKWKQAEINEGLYDENYHPTRICV